MSIIAVASDRADTGKTTAVLSLAAALAEIASDSPAVLIDLDPRGDATRRMGAARETASFGALMDGRRTPTDAIGSFNVRDAAHPTAEGFALVPAAEDIGAVEARFRDRSGGTSLLIYRLHALGRECRLMVDTAPGINTLLGRAVIHAADVVIIPVIPRSGADREVVAMVSILRGMGAEAHVFVIATQTREHGRDLAQLSEALRNEHLALDESLPYEDAIARSAASIGSPLALAPTSQCAASYRDLARKISNVVAIRNNHGSSANSTLSA